MTKFYAGMLVGFFLATALMFGIIQLYVSPYENDIKTAKPYAEEVYTITHSGYYADTQNVASKVKEVAAEIAEMPFIGAAVQKSQIESYANTAVALLENAKQSSEIGVMLVGWALLLISLTLPALLFSLLMIALGVWMYKNGSCPCCMEDEQKPVKGKKK